MTYNLLGYHRSGSARLYRTSRSALMFQIIDVMPSMQMAATTVFCLQFAGWQYQPPAGDQTCLG